MNIQAYAQLPLWPPEYFAVYCSDLIDHSLKYEEVYLKAYESMLETKRGIGYWLKFYNEERLHAKLDYKTLDEAYLESLEEKIKTKQAA